MATMNIKAEKERRQNHAVNLKQFVEEVGGADGWDDEKNKKFEAMNADLVRMDEHIEKLERMEEITPALDDVRDRTDREDFAVIKKHGDDAITSRDRDLAFRAFAMGNEAPPEFVRAAQKVKANHLSNRCSGLFLPRAPQSVDQAREMYAEHAEQRATTSYHNVGTATEGSEYVPNDVMQQVEIFRVAYGGVRRSGARIIRTASGGNMPVPTADDTATTAQGAILAENTATTSHSVVTGSATLGAFKFTSRLLGVSIELMQDAGFPMSEFLGEIIGTRIGRIENYYFTVGETSDTVPQGIAAASTNGASTGVTSSSQSEFSYANAVDLLHAVDPAYRMDASCGWMFNDATLALFRKMVDGNSRPLWIPSVVAPSEPDQILGYKYTINQNMLSFSSTGLTRTPLIFGAMNRYIIRDVMGLDILRLNERFADQAMVCFVGFARSDGDLVNRNAVKCLITLTT